jgi:hypothetical protein
MAWLHSPEKNPADPAIELIWKVLFACNTGCTYIVISTSTRVFAIIEIPYITLQSDTSSTINGVMLLRTLNKLKKTC